MEQKFCFCDRWDMEPCSTVYEVSPFSWDACPNGDPEWIYMLNRQEYLKKMLMAYWYTGQERYVEGMKQLYSALGKAKHEGNIRLSDDKDDRTPESGAHPGHHCFCIFLPRSTSKKRNCLKF